MFPLCSFHWEVFFFIINGCWILSKAFFTFLEMIIWVLFFSLLMLYITSPTALDLWVLNHPCIPGVNPAWSWCMIFSMYCWVQFADILLKIFAPMFIRDISLWFSFSFLFFSFFIFCGVFVWFWYQNNASLIEWCQKCSFLFSFFGVVWEE